MLLYFIVTLTHQSETLTPKAMTTTVKAINKVSIIDKMKYVVQCYISDTKGQIVKIQDYKSESDFWALEYAYTKACEFYNDVLPVPDNGRYEDYVL